MAFHKKLVGLLVQRPEVAIVPESANPPDLLPDLESAVKVTVSRTRRRYAATISAWVMSPSELGVR